jgi:WD40 repeat protein
MISPENLASMKSLARWGNGTLNHISVSPDESILAASSSIGIYIYAAGNGDLINYIDTGSWINVSAVSPDSQTVASGAGDGSVVIWDIQSRLIMTLTVNTQFTAFFSHPRRSSCRWSCSGFA